MDSDLGAVMVGILAAFATLLLAFAASGLWYWFFFTAALLAMLGIFELVAVRRTGITLSEQYHRLVKRKPLVGAILHATIGAFFGYLLYHLATGW